MENSNTNLVDEDSCHSALQRANSTNSRHDRLRRAKSTGPLHPFRRVRLVLNEHSQLSTSSVYDHMDIRPSTNIADLLDLLWSKSSNAHWPKEIYDRVSSDLKNNLIVTVKDYLQLPHSERIFIPYFIRQALDEYLDYLDEKKQRAAPLLLTRSSSVLIAGILPILAVIVVSNSLVDQYGFEKEFVLIHFSTSIVPFALFIYQPLINGEFIEKLWNVRGLGERVRIVSPVFCAYVISTSILLSLAIEENASTVLTVVVLMIPPMLMTLVGALLKGLLPLTIVFAQLLQMSCSMASFHLLSFGAPYSSHFTALKVVYAVFFACSFFGWTIPTIVNQKILSITWEYLKYKIYLCRIWIETKQHREKVQDTDAFDNSRVHVTAAA